MADKRLGRTAKTAIQFYITDLEKVISEAFAPIVGGCIEKKLIPIALASNLNDNMNGQTLQQRVGRLVQSIMAFVELDHNILDTFLYILFNKHGGKQARIVADNIAKKYGHDLPSYNSLIGNHTVPTTTTGGLVGDIKGKGTLAISTDSKQVNDTPLQEDSKKGAKIGQRGGSDETDSNTKGQSHGVEETDDKTIAQGGSLPDCYDISAKQDHGIALIITNIKWQKDTKFKDRPEAKEHEKMLSETFQKLGYKVICRRDVTGQKMIDLLSSVVDIGISREHDSFICCISSHGNASCVVGVDGGEVKVGDLAKIVNGSGCSDLNGKPKMFFIQACRGEEAITPVDNGESGAIEEDTLISSEKRSLPSEADFFFGFSTCQDKVAVRSAYIPVLCETINCYASHTSLYDMMVLVNDKVSQPKHRVKLPSGNIEDHQQIPEIVSRLRRKVFFKQ